MNKINKNWGVIIAIVFIASTLRAPLTSVGPVVDEIKHVMEINNSVAGILTTIPLVIFAKIVEYNIVRDIVRRAVTLETTGDTIAKITSGIVVSIPATLLFISITCFISSTTGPTEVSGARSVEERYHLLFLLLYHRLSLK